MELVISRQARDALHHMISAELASVGDIAIHLSSDEPADARRLRGRYEQDMRLLDDLGWDNATGAKQFVLTVPSQTLRLTLERLYWSTCATLACGTELERETFDHATRAQLTCSELLAQLIERMGPDGADVDLTVSQEVAREVAKQAGLSRDVTGSWIGPLGQRTHDLAQALDWGLARLMERN